MKRSRSADSLIPKYSKEKTIQLFINKASCKRFNKYKTYALITGTILLSYYSVNKNITFEIVGSILTTGYFTINLGFSYVENYLNQLDEWRNTEARYEEKTDPPEWNWKIINYTSHLAVVFSLFSCITQDISDYSDDYFYLGNGLQIISIIFKIKNDRSYKNLISCCMDFLSVLLFTINKFYSSTIIITIGTYIYVVSEIISL